MPNTKRARKLAFIDDFNIFSTDVITPPLFAQLTSRHGLDVRCLVPTYRKGANTNGIPPGAVEFVWNSANYPFKIFSTLRKENRKEVMLFLEQGTFGPPPALLLLPFLILLCRLAGCRILINLQGIVPLDDFKDAIEILIPRTRIPRASLKAVLFAVYSSTFKLADQIQVYAPTFGRWVLEYGDFREKLRLVSAGVADPQPHKAPPSISSQYILAFGHVVRRKGLDDAVVAWSEIHALYPNLKLVIAGSTSKDPEYVDRLRSLISTNNLSMAVQMVGAVSMEAMHALFDNCLAVIFPYIYSDSASGPVCTALQHRKPVIASKVGLFKDLFANGGAVFCDPRNPNSIADAVSSLLNSRELMTEVSSKISDLAKSLNWVNVGDRFFELLSEVDD